MKQRRTPIDALCERICEASWPTRICVGVLAVGLLPITFLGLVAITLVSGLVLFLDD